MSHPTTRPPTDDPSQVAHRAANDLSDVAAAKDVSVSDRGVLRFDLAAEKLPPSVMCVLGEHNMRLSGPCLHNEVSGQRCFAYYVGAE